MEFDVIVVGAGPTGLLLAYELGLAGVRTVVLDRLTEPDRQSRAGGVQPRTAEILDLRGLLTPMTGGRVQHLAEAGHFAGLPVPLDCTPWRTRHPYPVTLPQSDIHDYLAERITEHGTELRRGHELVALSANDTSVTATARTADGADVVLRARYLVGCDGGHSAVRKLAGFDFPGQPGTMAAAVVDVVLEHRTDPTGLRDAGHISRHMRAVGDHWTMLYPLADGVSRLVFGGPEQLAIPRTSPVTPDEVRAVLRAVHGDEMEVREVRAGSRFSDATRQVDRYRIGRILVAGDAAHIHPPMGGQGVNIGLQDAMNLGWKLAATVHGWAPDDLLDTYQAERYPVAAQVIRNARAQSVIMGPNPNPNVAALREILIDAVTLPDGNRLITGMVSGLSVHYRPADELGHALIGARVPDVDLITADGPGQLSDLLHRGRPVLLELGPEPQLAAVAEGWSDRVDHRIADATNDIDAAAVLIRPDGYAAWAGDSGDVEGARVALTKWFGAARPVSAVTRSD